MTGRVEERHGKFLLVLDLGRGENGKRKRQVITTEHKGRRAAEKELHKRLAELHAGTYQKPQKSTLGAFLAQWLEGTAKMRVSAKTWEEYESKIRMQIIPTLGHHRLDALTPALIQAAWAKLLVRLSPKSVTAGHNVLSTALTTAVKHGLLARNPCELVDKPRVPRTGREVLDAKQMNSLLDGLHGTRWHMLVLIACTTGMRRGEILALKWKDVDLETGILTVAAALEQTAAHGVRFKETKTGRVRAFPIPKRLWDELKTHRTAQAAAGLVGGLVICNPDGAPIRPDTVTKMFGDYMKRRPDLPRVRFHDLRHSAASLLLALKEPLPNVSAILGHSSVHTTLTVYAHVIPGSLDGTAVTMDEALREAR